MVKKKAESKQAGSANAGPTPGPWEVLMSNPLRLGDGILRPQIWAVNGGSIALCDATRVGSDTAEANARLIAAAPALADVLAEVLELMEDANAPFPKRAMENARAALKAAGWEADAPDKDPDAK